MKKTAFRRRLQRPRVKRKMAMINSADAAVKQAMLGADRSIYIPNILFLSHKIKEDESYTRQL